MSYIDAISQAATTTTPSKSKTSDIMGKQDFLTLLVAQLQNQDPLNPDDPTEFTAQLAQFSSLEQLFNLNESMNNLVTSNANADKFSTLQTIGKYVVYQGSKFEYDGEGNMQLGYQLDGPASEVSITIQQNGSTIAVLTGDQLTKGNHFLTWDGLTDSGVPAGSGDYTIAISVKGPEGGSVAASPLIKSLVTGVDLTGNFGGTLQTKAGEVAFNTILGVYDNDGTNGDNTAASTSAGAATPPLASTRNAPEENRTPNTSTLADIYRIMDDGQISLNYNY